MHASYADHQNHRTLLDPSRVRRQIPLPRLLCKLSLSGLSLLILVAAEAGCALMNAYAWDAPTLAAPDAARLAGPWATAQALNAERMGAAPLDKTEFILDDVALKQHRKFAEYSGDISGRWIGAAAFLAPQFPKAFAAFPAVMAGFPLYQKGDGHFGADQHLPAIDRKRDMPILWGNGRLVEVYDRTGDPTALALAKRLGDYFVTTDPIYNKAENIRNVGGSYADGFVTCYFSCIEGMVGLGRVTKDKRYLHREPAMLQSFPNQLAIDPQSGKVSPRWRVANQI